MTSNTVGCSQQITHGTTVSHTVSSSEVGALGAEVDQPTPLPATPAKSNLAKSDSPGGKDDSPLDGLCFSYIVSPQGVWEV